MDTIILAASNTFSQYSVSAPATTSNEAFGAGLIALIFGGSVIFTILIIIIATFIPLAISFGIGYLIYSDAKKHNIENPVLWGVISGITWIGIVLYFVINKRD
ncbi:MAG: hypothetical protein WCO33_00230 [bacterium]